MKVAIIHDWLWGMRGGERCLEVICGMFPGADIYTLFYSPTGISPSINSHHIRSSVLNRLPFVKKYYRYLLPAYKFGVRDLERQLSVELKRNSYQLVLSISHCVAKNVQVSVDCPHVCYCLTPARYLWDQYGAYFNSKLSEPIIRRLIDALRDWDIETADRVGHFVAISRFVADRIDKIYGREADVIYPPVRVDWIANTKNEPEEKNSSIGFLCANALVPYKNSEVVVEAFNRLGYPLTVVGTGPELNKLKALAKPNVRFLGAVSDLELGRLYKSASALVFAAEEDFGMIPVEIQAAGRPVICYGRGGVLETVQVFGEHPTGIYFSELSAEAICAAVESFNSRKSEFTVDNCMRQAEKFSLDRFSREFVRLISRVTPQVIPQSFQRRVRET